MTLGATILTLIIYVLAAARVTKLINSDKVTDPLRLAIARRAASAAAAADEADAAGQAVRAEEYRRRQARWMTGYEFAGCAWCVGFWISLAGVAPTVLIVGWPWWAALPLAFAASHLIGVAAPLSAEDVVLEEG